MTEHPDFDDEMFGDLLGDFLDESALLLEILSQRLIELDEILKARGDDYLPSGDYIDVINEVFRAAHSIKGASGMLGMANINAITHKMENQLDEIRSGKRHLTLPMIELLFTCINRLESLCDKVRASGDGRLTEREHEFIAWLEEEAARCDEKLVPQVVTAEAHVATPVFENGGAAHQPLLQENIASETSAVNARPNASDSTPEPEDKLHSEAKEQPSAETTEIFTPPSSVSDASTNAADADHGFDMQKYLQLYLDECEEEIESLNNALLTLESDPLSRDSINEVFRMAHRIKGSSAAMGFEEVTRLTHEIESIFDELRSGTRWLDESTMTALFKSVDGLRDYHAGLRLGKQSAIDLGELHRQLRDAPSTTESPSDNFSEEEATVPPECSEPGLGPVDDVSFPSEEADDSNAELPADDTTLCKIHVHFEPNLRFVDLKAEVILAKLKTRATIVSVHPAPEEFERTTELHLEVRSAVSLIALSRLVDIDGVSRIDLERYDASGTCAEEMSVGSHGTTTPALSSPPPVPGAGKAPALDPEAAKAPAQGPAKAPAKEQAGAVVLPAAPPLAVANAPRKVEEAPAKVAAPAAIETTGKVAETVRVEIDRLDHLMNLAGELVINKARFVQIANGMQSVFHGKSAHFASRDIAERLEGISSLLGAAREEGSTREDLDLLLSHFHRIQDDFRTVQDSLARVQEGRQQFTAMAEAIHQLTRVSDGIQKSVMETRMVPVGPLFVRFKRVIRDIARGAGKEVNLVIGGEKTELDKRMIDELGDPLIHMVRNAVDHGLETPEQRVAVGKPRAGTIRLDANHRGNSVVITVSDDGRGIDANRIRVKLVEKGLVSESDASQMSDKQVLSYIWAPGFSTAAKVTDISGRGVGMDIVKSKIEELSGTVDVKTEVGVGTTFSIRLPLTLAIMPSLLARICGEVYAMPLEAVEEIVKVPTGEIYSVQGKETVRVRDRIIALARLEDLFTWPIDWQQTQTQNLLPKGKEITVVIVQSNDVQIGLVVESLLGEDDIVIKSLAQNFVNVRGLAGASILGNGRVSLILDIAALIDMVCCSTKESA